MTNKSEMAIEETKKKIHFRPWVNEKGRPVDTDPPPTVNISRKYGTITFSKAAVRQTNMDGKFVKLFYEPTKRIIGWQTREKVEQQEMKTWKLCKPTASGTWVLGVKKLLDEFNGGMKAESYPGLEVQKYREMGPLDQYSNQTFFFIEVKEPELSAKETAHED